MFCKSFSALQHVRNMKKHQENLAISLNEALVRRGCMLGNILVNFLIGQSNGKWLQPSSVVLLPPFYFRALERRVCMWLKMVVVQAFLFDLFSASTPSGFAETLSFLLELLSFFPLSFERMFEDFKNSIFLL